MVDLCSLHRHAETTGNSSHDAHSQHPDPLSVIVLVTRLLQL